MVNLVVQEPEVRLENIDITEEMVTKAINKLKENSASGPDGIPSRVIKELKDEMVRPLKILFQNSMDDGKIPDDLREAEPQKLCQFSRKGAK